MFHVQWHWGIEATDCLQQEGEGESLHMGWSLLVVTINGDLQGAALECPAFLRISRLFSRSRNMGMKWHGMSMQVEPSEFARDLARISPELRRSPQIQFARAVAR